MKTKIMVKIGTRYLAVLLIVPSLLLFLQCSKEEDPEDCNSRTKRDQYFGYEVWAGDTALWGVKPDWSDFDPMVYYNINQYYTLIGSTDTTKTFSTGNYKYYVIAASWYCCIDAIQFADSSYYEAHMVVDGKPVTSIGGLAEHPPFGGVPAGDSARFLGAPDGISGNLGYKDLCKEPASFGGFMTDNATITARGGGLTVYVVNNCN